MAKSLNPEMVKTHFVVQNGLLYRRLKGGAFRRINTVRDGRLQALHEGQVLYGPDLAWVLYYGTPPMFPVFTLDGDPLNLSQENVVAGRIRRLRFRFKDGRNGFTHSLSPRVPFRTLIECKDDWIAQARRYYAADHATVRQLEDDLMRERPVQRYEPAARPVRGPGREATGRPKPPQWVAGMRHYWIGEQWVRVPDACHVADDYRVRCLLCLRGAVRFAYDEALGVVQGFDADNVIVKLA